MALTVLMALRGIFAAGVKTQGEFLSGVSKGGQGAVASMRLELRPLDSVCIHGVADWVDFVPVFVPEMDGVSVTPSMVEGFTINSNGTFRLALDGNSSAHGSVTVGAPPLSWGEVYADALIHRCESGEQSYCYACGRLHGNAADVNCSHAADCAARYDPDAECSCPMMFLKVNWRGDELKQFRAMGLTGSCWCHGGEYESSHLSGLTCSSELRLWSGSDSASSNTEWFEIEAVSATEGIGTGIIRYDVYDATNGLLRTVVRSVTAANIELRPDWNDDLYIGEYDRFLQDPVVRPAYWQLRVRDTPYLLQLASECPSAVALNLGMVCNGGVPPAVYSDPTGAPLTVVRRNMLMDVFVDTSAGEGDVTLAYTLGVTAAQTNIIDTLDIHVVDTTVAEKWIPVGLDSGVAYDYSHVGGDVWWQVWHETDSGDDYVDGGYGPVFSLEGLDAGDYRVEVYFDGVFEDGSWGYTSEGRLHVVDIGLARLYETANPANFIFNPTPKDDYTGSPVREEVIEDGLLRTYGAPRNNLYVAADVNTNLLRVTARLTVVPSNAVEHVYCGAYCDGVVKAVCALDTNGVARLEIPVDEDAVVTNMQIRAGLDLNGDETLSYGESSPLEVYRHDGVARNANIVGVSKESVESEDRWVMAYSSSVVGVVLPAARSMLALFYTGNVEDLAESWRPMRNETVTLDANADTAGFSEWLTHNAGADFEADDTRATIHDFEWGEGSRFSSELADCEPFAPWRATGGIVGESPSVMSHSLTSTGNVIMDVFQNELLPKAQRLLGDAPDGTVYVFSDGPEWNDDSVITNVLRSMSPSYIEGRTVTIGSMGDNDGALGVISAAIMEFAMSSPELKSADAFLAVGRGRVTNPEYRISVVKRIDGSGAAQYRLYQVEFSCMVSDLYDFNFEDGSLSRSAAILQLGYGRGESGRIHGKIFRHKVQIHKTYTYPFVE